MAFSLKANVCFNFSNTFSIRDTFINGMNRSNLRSLSSLRISVADKKNETIPVTDLMYVDGRVKNVEFM